MAELLKKNGTSTTFTQENVYNQNGIRISRTQGDTEREYYYNNDVVAYTEDDNELSGANI